MNDTSIVYTLNVIVGIVLAAVMSRHWWQEPVGAPLRYWTVAAWLLALADLLFVVRFVFPHVITRLLPTLMVTTGQLMIILAAERTTQRAPRWRAAGAVLLLHALVLVLQLNLPQLADWRSFGNALVWSALAIVGAWVLSRPVEGQPSLMQLPAIVLLSHGLFHLARLALAERAARAGDAAAGMAQRIQLVGDLEVSLFMVALFVSVLVAFLEQRNRELRIAIENVRQLSSMLPLCAWCKHVRDDSGYWTRIEAYLATHRVNVTHGICESCAAKHFEETSAPLL